jgi:hypothetical protein
MARATGPGKVESRSIPAADATTELAASLFNFDVDGDTPKPEHEKFLFENVVPFFLTPGVKIRLRGEASRSGSAAHNQALSQRRIDKVLAFLKRNGMLAAQFDRLATGESDAAATGQADGTEDERFRAVIVTVVNPLGRSPVRFSRARGSFINDGFDDTVNPPWVMIPTQEPIRLMQVENAQGFTLVSSNPGVAEPQPALFRQAGPVRITRQTQDFRIFGGVTGDAEIRALDAQGRVRGRLQVSVLAQRTVKCAFHYIKNGLYGTRTRNPGDEKEFIRLLNVIWETQANILFKQVPSNVGRPPVVMKDKLGNEINTLGNTVSGDMPVVTKHRDRTAQFNVFFVREVETDAEGTLNKAGNVTDTADAITVIGGAGDCIFEDAISGTRPETDKVAMAHEAGHCLTLDHDNPIKSSQIMLMFPTTDGGRFIAKAHALQAHRNVRK